MLFFFWSLQLYFRAFIVYLNKHQIWHWRLPFMGVLNDLVAAGLVYLSLHILFILIKKSYLRKFILLAISIFWIFISYINYLYTSTFNRLLPLDWFKEARVNSRAMSSDTIINDYLLSQDFLFLVAVPILFSFFITLKYGNKITSLKRKKHLLFVLICGISAQSATLDPAIQRIRKEPVQGHLLKYWYYDDGGLPKIRTAPLPDFSDNFKKVILEKESGSKKILPKVKIKNPNVVLIVLESYRAVENGTYGSTLGVSPNFDRYSKIGTVFNDIYALGDLTKDGQWGILCGMNKHRGGSVLTEYTEAPAYCMTDLLKDKGYDTWWFHGQSASYDFQGYYMQFHKVEHIMDRLTFPSDAKVVGWGLGDMDLMKHTLNNLDKMKEPFYLNIQSQTNHHPFKAPEGYTKNYGFESKTNRYLNTYRYTDDALGYFLDNFLKTEKGKRSLIIITSDQGMGERIANRKQFKKNKVLLQTQAPLLIIYPEGERDVQRTVNNIGSHADVYPTVTDILGLEIEEPIFGKSLIRDYKYRFAKSYGGRTNWITDGKKLYFSDRKQVFAYDVSKELKDQQEAESWFRLNEEIDDIQDWMIQQKTLEEVNKGLRSKSWDKF